MTYCSPVVQYGLTFTFPLASISGKINIQGHQLDNIGESAEDRKERRPVTWEGVTKVGNGTEGSE